MSEFEIIKVFYSFLRSLLSLNLEIIKSEFFLMINNIKVTMLGKTIDYFTFIINFFISILDNVLISFSNQSLNLKIIETIFIVLLCLWILGLCAKITIKLSLFVQSKLFYYEEFLNKIESSKIE